VRRWSVPPAPNTPTRPTPNTPTRPTPNTPAPYTLVTGDEELLASRAVSAVVAAARVRDASTQLHDLSSDAVTREALDEALSPSLFGEPRVLVVRGAHDLDKARGEMLCRSLADLPDDVCVVVVHAGGVKGKALLTALVAAGPQSQVSAARITKPADRRQFLRAELRADGRPVDEQAVIALLDAVGNDLRGLAVAAAQLLADTDGPITAAGVAVYHRGRAESTGYTVADRVVDGDLAGALELVRWGQSTGLAPVLVTSALAGTLRTMALAASAGRLPPHQIAAQLEMPPWKVERAQRQARGWLPEGLSTAMAAVAQADADVKGAAADAGYAVERLLLTVCQARQAGR